MTSIHVVAHTHWDREWYKTSEHFRVRLVYFMDDLLHLLEENPAFQHFTLDGQTVVLEDYLEIEPGNEERIKQLVRAGRLLVGPWYVQPDEFAPGGEALVRNLLIGEQIARRFGQKMNVGYLPDSFGQSAQMPQILKGFGIDKAVVMRGVAASQLSGPLFSWQGLNGDTVTTAYLPCGYANAMFLPENPTLASIRMIKLRWDLRRWAAAGNLLAMNGADQAWAQNHLPELIEHLNRRHPKIEYLQSTIPHYLAAALQDEPELPVLCGELVTPEKNRVHLSMASTRMYQKIRNREVETLLERYVEPVCSMGWLSGARYPKNLINQAWKYLLQNQAHDSIAGCCLDEVHRDIDRRFHAAEEIGGTLVKAYARALTRKMDRGDVVVFNNTLTPGTKLVTAVLYLGDEQFVLRDSNGREVPYELLEVSDVDVAKTNIWTAGLGIKDEKKRVTCSFLAEFDFNLGSRWYTIEEGKPPAKAEPAFELKKHRIESRYYILDILANGTMNLFVKATGKTYLGLHLFSDSGDAGDTYNYSPPENDLVVTSQGAQAEIEITRAGPLQACAVVKLGLRVPAGLALEANSRSADMVTIPIKTTVTLYSKLARIDFKTEIDNRARDHRLRVLFPTGVESDCSYAGTQFGTITRPNRVDDSRWEKEHWSEKPLPIYPMQRFVDIHDGKEGLAVLTRGLSEYEVYDQEGAVIALTLVRGVGYLGRKDLLVRPGRASGLEIPTPDAECPGRMVLEYSLVPHRGGVHEAGIPTLAASFAAPPLAVQKNFRIDARAPIRAGAKLFALGSFTGRIEKELEKLPAAKLITLTPQDLLLSAVKKAEDEDALVVRLYNASGRTVCGGRIAVGFAPTHAVLVDFAERPLEKELEQTSAGVFALPDVRPYTALTVTFRR